GGVPGLQLHRRAFGQVVLEVREVVGALVAGPHRAAAGGHGAIAIHDVARSVSTAIAERVFLDARASGVEPIRRRRIRLTGHQYGAVRTELAVADVFHLETRRSVLESRHRI